MEYQYDRKAIGKLRTAGGPLLTMKLWNIKEEFRWQYLGFSHDQPSFFVTSQFGWDIPNIYPVYLLAALVWHGVILILDARNTTVNNGAPYFLWMASLSNLSYMWLTVMVLVDLLSTLYVRQWAKHLFQFDYSENDNRQGLPWYMKISWFLFSCIATIAIVVTLVYWAWLDESSDFYSVMINAWNTVFIALHLSFTAKPIRLLHFYIPLAYMAIWFLFSVVYQVVSGHAIYKAIDWSKPTDTLKIVLPVLFVAVPVTHLLVYSVVQLRMYIAQIFFEAHVDIHALEMTKPKPLVEEGYI